MLCSKDHAIQFHPFFNFFSNRGRVVFFVSAEVSLASASYFQLLFLHGMETSLRASHCCYDLHYLLDGAIDWRERKGQRAMFRRNGFEP